MTKGLKNCPEIGRFFWSRAKGSAAGGVKSANSLRERGEGSGPPLKNLQDGSIYGHVLSRRELLAGTGAALGAAIVAGTAARTALGETTGKGVTKTFHCGALPSILPAVPAARAAGPAWMRATQTIGYLRSRTPAMRSNGFGKSPSRACFPSSLTLGKPSATAVSRAGDVQPLHAVALHEGVPDRGDLAA